MYLLSQMWSYLLLAFGVGIVAGVTLWQYCIARSYEGRFAFAADGVRRQAEIAANAKLQSLVSTAVDKLASEGIAARRDAAEAATVNMNALIRAHADEMQVVQARGRATLSEITRRHGADIADAQRQAAEENGRVRLLLETERQRVHELSSAPQNPGILYAPRNGQPDDLKLIWGVGDKLEKQLHKLGVYHFDQIAKWGQADIEWFSGHLGEFDDRITRDNWVDQSKKLVTGWRPGNAAGERLTA